MTNTTTVYSCMKNIKQFLQTSCKNLVLPPHQDTKYFETEELGTICKSFFFLNSFFNLYYFHFRCDDSLHLEQL
jgi:hypothetical protein